MIGALAMALFVAGTTFVNSGPDQLRTVKQSQLPKAGRVGRVRVVTDDTTNPLRIDNGSQWVSVGNVTTFDVTKPPYSATRDCTTDDSTAIQAAITAAAAASSADHGAAVYLPGATSSTQCYKVTRPLTAVGVNGLTIYGDGPATKLNGGVAIQGPIIYIGGNSGALPTGAALATGTGSSALFSGLGGASRWVGYTDNFNVTKNFVGGIATFTVEMFVNLTSGGSSANLIAYQDRGPYSPATNVQTFYMQTNTNGGAFDINWALRTGGTPHTGTASSVSLNVTHHIAMSYDGINIRVFIDGTQSGASVAASGTVAPTVYQDLTVGASMQDWPEAQLLNSEPYGRIDGVRVSKTARYTSNFTAPTVKPSFDSNTLVLDNFNNEQTNGLHQFYALDADGATQRTVWTPTRPSSGASAGAGTGAILRDLWIYGNNQGSAGIEINSTTNWRVERLNVYYTGWGIKILNNSFGGFAKGIFILGSGDPYFGPAGWLQGNASTFGNVSDIRVAGYLHQFLTVSSGGAFNNALASPSSSSVNSFMILGTANPNAVVSLKDCQVNNESTVDGTYLSEIHFKDINNATIVGGEIDSLHNEPNLALDNSNNISVFGTNFVTAGGNPGIVQIPTNGRTNAGPIQFIGAKKSQAAVPWTSSNANAPVTVVNATGIVSPDATANAFSITDNNSSPTTFLTIDSLTSGNGKRLQFPNGTVEFSKVGTNTVLVPDAQTTALRFLAANLDNFFYLDSSSAGSPSTHFQGTAKFNNDLSILGNRRIRFADSGLLPFASETGGDILKLRGDQGYFNLEFQGNTRLSFIGTTGQANINLISSVADALTIGDTGGTYGLRFNSSGTSLETVYTSLVFKGSVETVDFSQLANGSGSSVLKLATNLASGLEVRDNTTSMTTWVTTTGARALNLLNSTALGFGSSSGNNKITLVDNLASALNVTEAGNSYLDFVTTNGGEAIKPGKPFTLVDMRQAATTLDCNNTNDQTLWTCPTGVTCVMTHVYVRDCTSDLTLCTGSFGWNAGATDVVASATLTPLNGTTTYMAFLPDNNAAKGAAAGTFKYNGNTLESDTCTADVFGYIY